MKNILTTRTGSFPIGFRRGGGWQSDLPALLKWATEHRLGVIDLGADADTCGAAVRDAGLQVGSADLGGGVDWQQLLSPDKAKRKAAVEKSSAYIAACSQFGIKNFFFIALPEDPGLERKQNLSFAVESLSALEPVLKNSGARIVIEGWPGPGALCCTPETYRAFFAGCPLDVFGINYDPSHLIRMGIDPVRFLTEFHQRIYHLHGKDTLIDAEAVYQLGTEQPATLAEYVPFGGTFWRYTIPGHGQAPWPQIFTKLKEYKYKGAVSIELEDCNFNGTAEGEQQGYLASAAYLASV